MVASIPAVVVGLGLNGLGVVRSLARAGVPVIAVDSDRASPGMRTRYGRKVFVQALHGLALVRDLIALAESLGERPVLFATQEGTVRTVSAERDALAAHFRLTLPPPDILAALMHKESFHAFAMQHGFRVPRSLHVKDGVSLEAARTLRYPAVLKPGARHADYSRHFKKAYRIERFSDAAELAARIIPVLPDLMLQEWVEGTDADIYFCLQYIAADGRAVASFTGRKIRSWPPQIGGTASCTAAPAVAEELEAETTRFFRAAGFVGMGSMEYKQDRRSGEFFMIEPTVGRTDYQEEVATANGVNIPFAAYCAESGRAWTPGRRPVRPVIWRDARADRQSAALQRQRIGNEPYDAGRWIDGWWRWYDPLPSLRRLNDRLGGAGRRRLERWHLVKE